jgi:hypothetical protein
MELPDLSDFNLTQWSTWVAFGVGVLTSGLTFLIGGLLIRERRRRAAARAEMNHDPFVLGSMTEQRASVRRKGNPVEVLISDADAKQEPSRGWVVDRSMGGLCLMLSSPVDADAVLSVKPREAAPGIAWVRVLVRNCREEGSGFAVSVQFERTPTWNVLLLFG